jgi:hypothetical protein
MVFLFGMKRKESGRQVGRFATRDFVVPGRNVNESSFASLRRSSPIHLDSDEVSWIANLGAMTLLAVVSSQTPTLSVITIIHTWPRRLARSLSFLLVPSTIVLKIHA